MSDFLHFATSCGISVYGISSHAPTPFPNHWAMKFSDVFDYFSEFRRLRDLYKDKLELYIGMELDFLTIPSLLTETSSPLFSYPLDYRIGSVHYLDPLTNPDGSSLFWNVGGSVTHYAQALHELYGDDINRLVRRYNGQILTMLQSAPIHVLAHCDLETTIAERHFGFDPSQPWFLDQMHQIFALARQRDIIVEVNVKHLLSDGITSPHQRLFSLLKDSGVSIQVNSDAHYPQHVASGLREAHALLRQYGFSSQRVLLHGSWTDIPLLS